MRSLKTRIVQFLGLDLLTHEPDVEDDAALQAAPGPRLEQLPAFVRAHQLGKLARRTHPVPVGEASPLVIDQNTKWHDVEAIAHEDDYDADTEFVDDLADAEVVLSLTGAKQVQFGIERPMHRPVIDVDFPVAVLPSSTPGHHHLYIDKEMDWWEYRRLLSALADVGIIERGYLQASEARQFTSVRLPWVRKAASK